MDNDDVKMVEAKIELERISDLQKYKEEFDKLGSNHWGLKDFLSIIAPFGLLLIANSFFTIEAELFQIMCVIFFALLRLLYKAWLRLKVKRQIAEWIFC